MLSPILRAGRFEERGISAPSVHPTQREAIGAGREAAIRNQSEMLIHGENGRIRERNTYGRDPYPPKG